MMITYKAIRKNKKSWYDNETKWGRVGSIVRVSDPDGPTTIVCGHGIHSSPTLLDAASYQGGSSLYLALEPFDVICRDETKLRSSAVKIVQWLKQKEVDELAGFKLWEANNAVNPLLIRPDTSLDTKALVREWASVCASVGASVWDSVGDSVGDSVWDSVRASVWDSVRASVGASVWDSVRASVGALVCASVGASVWDSVGDSVWDSVGASVRDSVWTSVWDSVRAYTGGLFPNITAWKGAKMLGPDPWRPLLTLWYGGYLPSFDGTTWRVHAGKKAKIVAAYTKEELE